MKIIRLPAVAEKTGWSKATVWRKVKTDTTFPQPIKVSENCTGWVESEIDDWLVSRVSESREADFQSKKNQLASTESRRATVKPLAS